MKNFIKLFTSVILLTSSIMFGQQDPNFNMYRFNMNIINPAYAGSSETAEAVMMHKSQWLGLGGAPETQTFYYHKAIRNNLGIGASIINDNIYVLGQTNFNIDVSYKLKLSEETDLFFGIKPGGAFTSIDLTKVGQDGVSDNLFERTESYFAPTFGVGFYLRNKNWYINMSTPNLISADKLIRKQGVPSAVTVTPHFYVGSGYSIKLTNQVTVTPEFMIRAAVGAPNSYNLALNYEILNKIDAGINWRIRENSGLYGLFKINKGLSLGFGYDFTTSRVIQTDKNYSIEFLAKYRFL